MKTFYRIFAVASLSFALSACSDSILFDPNESAGVPAIPPPRPAMPSGPVNAANPVPAQVMSFQLDPDPSLSDSQVLQSLFTDQSINAFQVQNAGEFEIDMAMESESIDKDAGKNYVRLKLKLSLKGTTLTREYASNGSIVLKNSGAKDFIGDNGGSKDGQTDHNELRAVDGRGGSLYITGDRIASPSAEAAQRNAWSGSLLNESRARIGTFQGFAH